MQVGEYFAFPNGIQKSKNSRLDCKICDFPSNILATVRVLPDKSLPEPLTTLQYPTPYPYMQYLPFNKYSTELDSNNNGTMSKISNDSNDSAVNNVNYNTFNGQAGINSDFKNSQDEVQKQNFLPTPTADGSAPFKKSKVSVSLTISHLIFVLLNRTNNLI